MSGGRERIGAWRRALARRRTEDPRGFRAGVVLGLALFVLVLRLVLGDDPFTGGIAERVARGRPIRPIDYERTWGFWVALGNAGILVALLRTRRRWLGPAEPPLRPELAPPRGSRAGFAVAVAAAVALLAFLAAPRLSQSLWGDEVTSLHRGIAGVYGTDADGRLAFLPLKWRETWWNYTQPDNHVPFSVVARVGVELWQAIRKPELRFVDERVLRLPALAFGLAGVVALALFVRRLGYPAAGAIAAWILALHPWYLRYTSEARGYSLLLLCIASLWLLLVAALHRGTWPRWLGYGAMQALLLWCNPSAIHLVALTNLGALAALAWHHRPPDRLPPLLRWGVASLLGAMAWAQLMVPNLLQLGNYLDAQTPVRMDTAAFARNFASYLWIGTPWGAAGGNPIYPELADRAAASPLAVALAAAVTALAVGIGALRLLRRGGLHAALVPALLFAAPLGYVFAWLQRYYLYVWYLVFALPGFVALLALGLDAAARALRPRRLRGPLAAVLAVACLGGFVWLTAPAREALRSRSLQPLRESVRITRPVEDPFAPENARILTFSVQTPPQYYDPRVIFSRRMEDLEAAMAESDRTGRPLFVNYGRPRLARKRAPELLEVFHDPTRFERVAVLRGFEPKHVRYVYRYRGRATPSSSAPAGVAPASDGATSRARSRRPAAR